MFELPLSLYECAIAIVLQINYFQKNMIGFIKFLCLAVSFVMIYLSEFNLSLFFLSTCIGFNFIEKDKRNISLVINLVLGLCMLQLSNLTDVTGYTLGILVFIQMIFYRKRNFYYITATIIMMAMFGKTNPYLLLPFVGLLVAGGYFNTKIKKYECFLSIVCFVVFGALVKDLSGVNSLILVFLMLNSIRELNRINLNKEVYSE